MDDLLNTETMTDEELQAAQLKVESDGALLDAYRAYDGEDKVVESHELRAFLAKQPRVPTLQSKFNNLDHYTGGFRQGELIVMSGPTGQGKTTFLQSLTYSFAEQEVPCMWFSFEVPAADLFERFGDDLPYFVLPAKIKGSTLLWVADRVWESIAKYNVKVVFIDHLHFLLSMSDLAKANTSITIGAIMREVKKLALETNTIIFLISHITKLSDGKEPGIDDLRDSSFTAQEADMVLMTYRLLDPNTKQPGNKNNLSVLKSRRTGRLGKLKLVFENGRFREEGQGDIQLPAQTSMPRERDDDIEVEVSSDERIPEATQGVIQF